MMTGVKITVLKVIDMICNDVVMIISPKEITMPMMMTVVMTMILVV